MSGVVLGSVGSAAGVILGLVASLALEPSLDRITGTLIEGLVIPPLQVAGAGVLGVAAASAAAWLPARSVARIPAAAALAGRRPLTRPRRLASLLGVTAVASGCGLAALGARQAQLPLIVAGAVAVVAGFAAWSPTLVGTLGHLATWLPTSLRLAVRDAARHRTRVGPAASAVMAALSMPVAVATYTATTDAQARADYVPLLADDQLLVAGDSHDTGALRQASEAVSEAIPGTVAAPMMQAVTPGPDEAGMTASEGSLDNVFVLVDRPEPATGPFVPSPSPPACSRPSLSWLPVAPPTSSCCPGPPWPRQPWSSPCSPPWVPDCRPGRPRPASPVVWRDPDLPAPSGPSSGCYSHRSRDQNDWEAGPG